MCNMALKLLPYFYLLMKKPLDSYFQVRSPYYQTPLCNPRRTIPVSSRWKVRSAFISLISFSLNWSNKNIRFSFNKPNRKRWGVRLVDVIKYLPYKHINWLFWNWFLNISRVFQIALRGGEIPPPLGQIRNFSRGFFLSGGGDLMRGDFDHSKLF